MRILIIIVLALIQFGLYAQNKDRFNISGTIKERESKIALSGCELSVTTSSGLNYKSKSDSNGYYKIENLSASDKFFVIVIKRPKFFNEDIRIYFYNQPHDTIIDIELRMLDLHHNWLPDFHFKYNKVILERKDKELFEYYVELLYANPTLIFSIIGFMDSEETKDLRLERANYILNKLIKLGIDKNRFKISISNNPNILKENTVKVDYITRQIKNIYLTDEYISSYTSKKDRKMLRRQNRCVSFEIIGDNYLIK